MLALFLRYKLLFVMSFVIICSLSVLIIAVTSLITYEILRLVWHILPRVNIAPRLRVLLLIIPIFSAHIIAIWIYALVYLFVECYTDFGELTGAIGKAVMTFESFKERLYFSSTTYTSLGTGDIVATSDLRMLASAEVLNGLVMIGWTISITYLAMEKFWSLHQRRSVRNGRVEKDDVNSD